MGSHANNFLGRKPSKHELKVRAVISTIRRESESYVGEDEVEKLSNYLRDNKSKHMATNEGRYAVTQLEILLESQSK